MTDSGSLVAPTTPTPAAPTPAAPTPAAPTPAARAAADPARSFQTATAELGLGFDAPIPVRTPLVPVIEELLALVERVPDKERIFAGHDGTWSSIVLIQHDMNDQENGIRTPWMETLPRTSGLLAEFGDRIASATIARIGPGDLLDWHYDPVGPEMEMTRLHLPIATDPEAVTDFCHERVHWPVGAVYYGDYGFPHRVFNTGTQDRLHLYFDVHSNVVRDHLPADLRAPRRALREPTVNAMLAFRFGNGS